MLQRMSQKNFTESGTEDSTAEKRCDKILRLMKLDKEIIYDNPVNTLHVSRRIIVRDIDLLCSHNQANERRQRL